MKKKKPEGSQLKIFCEEWDKIDREGKQRVADFYETSYGTACNWRSQVSTEYPFPKPMVERPFKVGVDDLLAMRPAVNLDFVCFDIETSNLKADFSILLSTVIKPFGQAPIVFRADEYPEWENNRSNDYSITKDITEELRNHAIVVAHYGERFDIPYIRAKMVHHSLPVLPPMFAIDTWRIAKLNFQVSSRRMQNLARYFDVGEKSGVDGQLWCEAAYDGSKEALDEIVKHNITDCEVLEKLACITFPLLKSVKRL